MKIKSTFAAPVLMLVVLALIAITNLLDPAMLNMGGEPYLTVMMLELMVYAIPAVFFCRLRGREYGHRLRFRPFRLSHIFLIFLALVLMTVGCALLNYAMMAVFPEAVSASYEGVSEAGIYAVLALCILPAAAEEFLFRGILLAEYESLSIPCAVVFSSLFFGMMHMNFARLPAYIFSGVVLALVAYATRSVLASMLLHMLHNLTALLTDNYILRFAGAVGGQGVLLTFILLSVLMGALILFFMEAQRVYQDYGERGLPSPHHHRRKRGESAGFAESFGAPPFILFCALFILFTLIIP